MRVWSLIAAVVVGSFATTSMAQQPAASQSPMTIAVVDVGHILKNHPTMTSQLEAIKGKMESADKAMTQKRDAILKQMEELREKYTEGTPEYDREEKAIAEQDTLFRLEIVKMRKQFEKSRATVLYNVYTNIQRYLKHACTQSGYQVVLHVKGSREKLDPAKPDGVQMMMSQEVLHFDPRADLTNWILDGFKEEQTARATGATQR